MPRRTVLSSSQRERFERLPSETEELVRHYSLSGEDMALIFQRREERNRLGFAVQLCLLRHPGRTLEAGEQVPEKLVAFVAEGV
jgi:TnpA family transposase